MAQTILLPLLETGNFKPDEVFGVVGQKASVQRAKDQLPSGVRIFCAEDPSSLEVWTAPIRLLAIKPQQLPSIERQLDHTELPVPKSRAMLISLLAGVKLKRLGMIFPTCSCARAVPNTPALVRAGLTGLSWGDGITIDQKLLVEKFFEPISEVLALPENQLDAFLALTSSGPAYIALIAEALSDGAVAAGLPRLLANYLVPRTLLGTSLLLKEKELHPGQLKDMVASPGGTTITALRHLERAGVRSALMEAVIVAAERSRELA